MELHLRQRLSALAHLEGMSWQLFATLPRKCACMLQLVYTGNQGTCMPMSGLATLLRRLFGSSERGQQKSRPHFLQCSWFPRLPNLSSSELPIRACFLVPYYPHLHTYPQCNLNVVFVLIVWAPATYPQFIYS